jgi:hypothetical protein
MFKYMLILVFVVVMMCSLSVSFAQGNSTSSCEATVKCVCQSLLKTRVVPCPTDNLPEGFFTNDNPPGTLGVDCSIPLNDSPAMCEELDFHCKRKLGEQQNCLLTLPLFVAPSALAPTPTPTPNCLDPHVTQSGPIGANCDFCTDVVCNGCSSCGPPISADPFCCTSLWDGTCVNAYEQCLCTFFGVCS